MALFLSTDQPGKSHSVSKGKAISGHKKVDQPSCPSQANSLARINFTENSPAAWMPDRNMKVDKLSHPSQVSSLARKTFTRNSLAALKLAQY
jgi:hypothetical protein